MQERRKLLLLSLVTGLCSGLAAVLLLNVISRLKILVLPVRGIAGWLFLLLPGIGMLLSLLIKKFVIRDNIDHGVTRVLYAISRRESRIKPHNTWSSLLTSSLTIGLGGSVGAEAPIVFTGAAIGSNLGRVSGLSYKSITLLLGCGAAGAVAGIFKAPMASLLFVMEILLFNVSLSTLAPMLISSLSATVVSYFFTGTDPMFVCELTPFSMVNIPFYLILGAVCAFGSLYFMRTTLWLEDKFAKIRGDYPRWFIGALGLGVLIMLFPMLYGEGYDIVQSLLSADAGSVAMESAFGPLTGAGWGLALFFLLLFLTKVLAMIFTNSGGGVGGTFGPTLVAGAILGFVVAKTINLLGYPAPIQNFVLVGMAGLMAGVMQAPMTAIFLIAEISGGYQLMLPLIISATTSFVIFHIFEKYSIYSKRIAQSGDLLTHDSDQAVLTLMKVSDLVKDKYPRVGMDDSLGRLAKVFRTTTAAIFVVVDAQDRYQGIVDVEKLHKLFLDRSRYDKMHVSDFVETDLAAIRIDESMNSVMEKFEHTKAWRLPVLDADGRYLGCISNTRILMAYREELKAITIQD